MSVNLVFVSINFIIKVKFHEAASLCFIRHAPIWEIPRSKSWNMSWNVLRSQRYRNRSRTYLFTQNIDRQKWRKRTLLSERWFRHQKNASSRPRRIRFHSGFHSLIKYSSSRTKLIVMYFIVVAADFITEAL